MTEYEIKFLHKSSTEGLFYGISPVIIRQSFFIPKLSQNSRSILDGSRSLGLFRKGKTCLAARFLGLI